MTGSYSYTEKSAMPAQRVRYTNKVRNAPKVSGWLGFLL